MSANTSCRQRSPPGYEHEVTIQIYRLALANPTAVSRGSRRWPKFINFYKNVTIESRTLRDFEHRLAPPPQGPGPRDPGAKLARTPGPQRQIGPDPGPWPRPGLRTARRFWACGSWVDVWGAHDVGSRLSGLCLRVFLRTTRLSKTSQRVRVIKNRLGLAVPCPPLCI